MSNKYIHTKVIRLMLISVLISISSYGQHRTGFRGKHAPEHSSIKAQPLQAGAIRERPVEETLLNKLKNDEAFWYANLKPDRQKPADRTSFWVDLLQRPSVKSFLWLFISISFTAVLLWYLAVSNINLFRKAPKRMEDRPEDALPVNIFSLDYPAEIQAAVSNKNFRLAVRLLFLQTLKKLAEKDIIQYGADRTDSDYVRQLSTTSYYKDFLNLTQNFEYVWYGQMDIHATTYEVMKTDYENFHQRLSY